MNVKIVKNSFLLGWMFQVFLELSPKQFPCKSHLLTFFETDSMRTCREGRMEE